MLQQSKDILKIWEERAQRYHEHVKEWVYGDALYEQEFATASFI